MRRSPLVLLTVVLLVGAAVPAGATQGMVTLTVTVVNENGSTLSGVTVTASWDDGSDTATTSSNGKALLDVPEGADVYLDAESDRYVRNTPKLVEDASEEEVTVEVGRKGDLAVRTTEPDGALADVRVEVLEDGQLVAEGVTGDDGRYDAPALEQGTYTIYTYKSGYFANQTVITLGVSHTQSVPMRQGTVNVQFTVVDDHFEEPRRLDGATVQVGDVGTVRTTQGRASLSVPVNTRVEVTATKEGYGTARRTLRVGESPTELRLAVQLEPELTVTAFNERVVVGQQTLVNVTNAYGEPVAGAAVTVDGEAVAETDADGRARIIIETEGDHEVRATLDGVTSDPVTVAGVPEGEGPTPTPTPSPTPTGTTDVVLPGFGAAAALAAIAALVLVALARRP